MFLLPVSDQNPAAKTPIVNYSIIGLNIFVFLIANVLLGQDFLGTISEEVVRRFAFQPSQFSIITLFTSMFLHADIFHLFGNMLFLWIVGDNVEDKFGKGGYIAFYLICGVAAEFAHMIFAFTTGTESIRTLGASGAISGVMGAYLILFPRAKVKFYYLFWFYVGKFYLSSGWWIGLWFVYQLLMAILFSGRGGVAVWAHIGGAVFGAVITIILVLAGILSKAGSVFAPPQKVARKRFYRQGEKPRFLYDVPYPTPIQGESNLVSLQLDESDSSLNAAQVSNANKNAFRELQLGGAPAYAKRITESMSRGDIDEALRLTSAFSGRFRSWKLPPNILIDIANEYFKRHIYDMALSAYAKYVKLYPQSADVLVARFRLGMLYSRYLRDFTLAKRYLTDVVQLDNDVKRINAAKKELTAIDAMLRKTSVATAGKPRLVSGTCSIIRQTDDKINIMDVGRLISRTLKIPMVDVTTKLKGTIGFIAQGVEAPVAMSLAQQLQKIDVPVLVVADKELVDIPEPQYPSKIEISDTGITFYPRGGEKEYKTWDDVYLVSAGKVEYTARQTGYKGPKYGDAPMVIPGVANMPVGVTGVFSSYTPGDNITKYEYKIIVDIFVLNPYEHFRLRENEVIVHSADKAGQSGLQNFKYMIREILEKGKNIPVNKGVYLLGQPMANWSRLTFPSEMAFNAYNHWQLQLVAFGE